MTRKELIYAIQTEPDYSLLPEGWQRLVDEVVDYLRTHPEPEPSPEEESRG